jgi:hypothetical protein
MVTVEGSNTREPLSEPSFTVASAWAARVTAREATDTAAAWATLLRLAWTCTLRAGLTAVLAAVARRAIVAGWRLFGGWEECNEEAWARYAGARALKPPDALVQLGGRRNLIRGFGGGLAATARVGELGHHSCQQPAAAAPSAPWAAAAASHWVPAGAAGGRHGPRHAAGQPRRGGSDARPPAFLLCCRVTAHDAQLLPLGSGGPLRPPGCLDWPRTTATTWTSARRPWHRAPALLNQRPGGSSQVAQRASCGAGSGVAAARASRQAPVVVRQAGRAAGLVPAGCSRAMPLAPERVTPPAPAACPSTASISPCSLPCRAHTLSLNMAPSSRQRRDSGLPDQAGRAGAKRRARRGVPLAWGGGRVRWQQECRSVGRAGAGGEAARQATQRPGQGRRAAQQPPSQPLPPPPSTTPDRLARLLQATPSLLLCCSPAQPRAPGQPLPGS